MQSPSRIARLLKRDGSALEDDSFHSGRRSGTLRFGFGTEPRNKACEAKSDRLAPDAPTRRRSLRLSAYTSAVSDERLRTLEARWKQSGLVEDEAAWLLERTRCGDLSPERLELASGLGDPASRLALNHERSYQPPERGAFLRWACTLEPTTRIRVVLASARSLLARSGETDTGPGGSAAEEALRSVGAWAVCPCGDHLSQVLEHDGLSSHMLDFADPRHQAATALQSLVEFLRRGDEKALDLALIRASHSNPLVAVQGELIPWALGRSDPLAERSG